MKARSMSQPNFDRSNVPAPAVHSCKGAPCAGVGAQEAACQPAQTQPLDDERELHIEDAHHQYRIAYERFELHGCPHDRDEALLHLHRMNAAILGRSPEVLAQRQAEFERAVSEGVGFFASDLALALARVAPGRVRP